MCCYFSLVESLLDQWGILKHFPQSRCIFNLYLSLVERIEAEVYHIMDRRRYLVELKRINFISIWRELLVSLSLEQVELSTSLKEYFF